ncbi:MAG: hypothetical protein J6X42_04270 [Alphaproteobacteria bacterium]|nr:hypothetical protein [Alphaproteobacteria bacterium]
MAQDKNSDIVVKEDLWYIENYLILKDYYDMTISRIAARCIRMGNIAMEEYPFYHYILDVVEEICETGEYILSKKALYPYVEKKIAGGVKALEENLALYQQELENNSSPEMVKQDPQELAKVKEIMSNTDKAVDPTVGAGMNIDDLMAKLLEENKQENPDVVYEQFDEPGDKK